VGFPIFHLFIEAVASCISTHFPVTTTINTTTTALHCTSAYSIHTFLASHLMANMKHTCILLLHLTRMSAVCPRAHAAVRQGILASTSSISPVAFCTCSTWPTPLVSIRCPFVFVGHTLYLAHTISQDPALHTSAFGLAQLACAKKFLYFAAKTLLLTVALFLPPPLLVLSIYYSPTLVIITTTVTAVIATYFLNHNANIYSLTVPTTARAANPQPHPRPRT
jgi:hypothetical protein